jgi:hypothetical protein
VIVALTAWYVLSHKALVRMQLMFWRIRLAITIHQLEIR